MKALSINQPWAQLIIAGIKPVENRSWPTPVRGEILIHASKKFDSKGFFWLLNNWHKHGLPPAVDDLLRTRDDIGWSRGAVIGTAELTDCVTSHPSPFFGGPFGLHADDRGAVRMPIVQGVFQQGLENIAQTVLVNGNLGQIADREGGPKLL